MTETTDKFPARNGRVLWSGHISLILFVCATAASVAGCAILGRLQYRHAIALYVAAQYAMVLPALVWFLRSNRAASPRRLSVGDFRLAAAAILGVLSVVVAMSYDHGHTIPDESAYQFQARVFASGHVMAAPLPGSTVAAVNTPPEIYFENQIDTTRGWFAKYTPGYPLLLSLGYLLHCPWLVNPVLGLLLLAGVSSVASLYGTAVRNTAVLLVAFSAYTLLYSVGYLSHAFSALVGLGATGSAIHAVRRKSLVGVVVCYSLIIAGTEIRPYTGAVIAVLCTIYTCWGSLDAPYFLRRAIGIAGAAAVISVALFLAGNRVFTGNFLMSPYAYAQGAMRIRELSLSFPLIFHNVLSEWRPAIVDTLFSTVPFVALAAGYACVRERQFRKEILLLSAVFPALVVAYFFETMGGSASFDGERYYYEGFAILCVAAARGLSLLVSDWRIRNGAAVAALSVLLATQVLPITWVIRDIESHLSPWRKAYQASIVPPAPRLVLLSGATNEFTAKHANWNAADWQSEPTIFLNDPGPPRRREVACRFGASAYRVVSYDSRQRRAVSHDFASGCGGR